MVELASHGVQAGFDIAETLSVSELSKGHRQVLIPARQLSVMMIAVISGDTLLELDVGEVSNQLRENSPAGVHSPLFRQRSIRVFT
jgi:hypothetical protein